MRHRALIAIVLLGLALRIGYTIAVYEPSLAVYHGGDYELYRIGAQAIWRGDLSFTNDAFLLRPPLFPLMMAALDLRPMLILAANILLSTAIIFLTYVIGRQLDLSHKSALLAAALVAFDPASLKYCAVLLAEPLANLTFASALLSALALRRARASRSVCLWGILLGAFVVMSALARPAAEYVWLLFGLWIVCVRRDKRLVAALAIALVALLGAGSWRLHNVTTFGHNSFTTLGNWNLLYKRAASVLHQAEGLDIELALTELTRRVEAGLGNDPTNISAAKRHHHYTGTVELQNIMTDVAVDVFLAYPLYYLLTFMVGLYRQLFDTVGPLSLPGIIWNIGLLSAASYGLWRLLRERRWGDVFFFLLPCAYFLLGSLVFCTACSSGRDRATVIPLLAVMAAYGLMRLLNRRITASESPSPPADS